MTTCRSITLDISLFNVLHYPNGYIPSGIALAKLTASGMYGPYSPLLSNGLEAGAFLLLDDARVADGNGNAFTRSTGAGFWEGIVNTAALPTFTGGAAALGVVDAAFKTAVPTIRYEAS